MIENNTLENSPKILKDTGWIKHNSGNNVTLYKFNNKDNFNRIHIYMIQYNDHGNVKLSPANIKINNADTIAFYTEDSNQNIIKGTTPLAANALINILPVNTMSCENGIILLPREKFVLSEVAGTQNSTIMYRIIITEYSEVNP